MACVHSSSSSGVTVGTAAALDDRSTLHVQLCGVRFDHVGREQMITRMQARLADDEAAPLAVGSINLDHIHHFGSHRGSAVPHLGRLGVNLEWLMVVDGAPVARRAATVTGLPWPRLPGADLLPDMLSAAERSGVRVGFLGGLPESTPELRQRLADRWPDLQPVSFWTPPRDEIDDLTKSRALAARVADAGVELLVVGLGKPRQERWIEQHGLGTQARVLAAFGAAADFLAGSARRAPLWMRRTGCEWAFRLAQEPHRLARRYLVEGPPALLALRQATPTFSVSRAWPDTAELDSAAEPDAGTDVAGSDVTGSDSAGSDVTVIPAPEPPTRRPSPHS